MGHGPGLEEGSMGLGIGQGRGRGRQSGRSTLGGTLALALALALLLDSGSGSRTGVVGLQWLRASIALRIANGTNDDLLYRPPVQQ
jgi:hypothetical protein